MNLASDRNIDFDKLSPNARKMHSLRDDVLAEWIDRLRKKVKEATQLPKPILINTLPALYDNLTEAISPNYPRVMATEGNTVASEHGGERARLTKYNAQAVIAEYQQLRWTIFDVLKSNGVHLTEDEAFIINASIDEAIRESVNAFALAQSVLRERFVAALTHDLRSPLAAAHAAAELVQHSPDLNKINDLAGHIIKNLNRMDSMIQELLDSVVFHFGERLQLRIEEFDMLEIANDVCAQFAATHGPRFEVAGNAVIGWWDRDAMKRALENLIGNAIKYGADESPIQIKVDATHERVMVTVHNEGAAIIPEHLESIFQIYHRAVAAEKGDKQGWGIGLPYVRSVAESHGGSVSVDSVPERGTTFLIDVPVDARPFQEAATLGQRLY